MATITITHTRADGTLLDGSRKGDGVFEIVKHYGFWFSRSLGSLYIRRSQDKEAQMWRINGAADALRKAGHEVTIEIAEDIRRTFAEAEAEREERAEGRADRFADRAGRAASASEAARKRGDEIAERFPFGQPILVGHHSEPRARRDQERIDRAMRKQIDEGKRAGYWSDRARTADSYKEHRNDPQRTRRRLERLHADLRQQERFQDQAAEGGWDAERYARNITDLTEKIAHWERIVEKAKADGVKLWEPEDFAPGDFALYCGFWHEVKRVNPKTLSIAWNLRIYPRQVTTLEDATEFGRTGTHPADYTKVEGRCPGEAMRAFLADGKAPGRKAAREASAAAPAEAVRRAQAAKPKRRSDPKIPKRVKVDCRWGATEATVTWLNGRSQPHPDHPAVTITAPAGVKYNESVGSRPLHSQVGQLLAERGYTLRGRWTGGPARGIVCGIEPAQTEQTAMAEEAPAATGGGDGQLTLV